MTEIVFILDRSGSMSGIEKDTIGGFNSMLEKQRKEPGEAVVSTVLFDNEIEVVHDRIGIKEVPKLTEEEYFVRGCTALLDAVGGAIHHIGNIADGCGAFFPVRFKNAHDLKKIGSHSGNLAIQLSIGFFLRN